MTDAEVPRQPNTFALWREVDDTCIRTRLGGIFYLLAWLLTWVFSAKPGELVLSGVVGCTLFGALLAARLLHRPDGLESPEQLQRWLDRHWGLIIVTALCWGQAHALAVYSDAYNDSEMIATLATVAFATAMTFNFAMRRGRALLALVLLYLPGLTVMALNWQQKHTVLITLIFYLSYLILVLGRNHREYRATLDLELKLLEQQSQLDLLSRTDSLTQLGNRYQFNNLFPSLVANAVRQGEPLSLVLMDIDFFKKVNDEHGHAGGDACLSAFAERMRKVFRRDADALLRLGGEEFGVLLPGTTLAQAWDLAEHFRQELEAEGLLLAGQRLTLTTSLGVGCFSSRHDGDADAFFKRVDGALYRAKREGRNRLVAADH
ncbi:GGDEF domain-containing protein [Ectopseudomonas mendocina]|uniref:GGDEF domain-containing protein n=1 Tax=Ectopseudomonas mendocina TaxID=300 RepID=UPI0005A13143|nr:GGDEF domain-containing protein [Pseudomonas mendocina]MDF2075559.1 GGDEF domain-containing protein [Pseudomonas mendocina]